VSKKSKVFIITGFCATGKSTFSNRLADELAIPCFNKDTLKETLADGFEPEGEVVQKNGSRVTFMLLCHLLEKFLKVGQSCILEGNFTATEMQIFQKMLGNYQTETQTFIFKGDFDILFQRYNERAASRHWVHKSAGDTVEVFKKVQTSVGIGEVGIGKIVDVETSSFEAVDFECLVNIARDFL
jgi:adenylate kinase family enzyme